MAQAEADLDDVAAAVDSLPGVERAWWMRSFGTPVVALEVPHGAAVPEAAVERLRDVGLHPTGAVDGDDGDSFVGQVGDADRHRFVDPDVR
ncbi:MAG: hypothetical protein ABEJ68_05945 [Halobacteriaceae archaeon]